MGLQGLVLDLPGSPFMWGFGIGTHSHTALWLRRQWKCSKVRADCYLKHVSSVNLPTWLLVRLQLQLERSSSDRQFRNPIDCTRQVIRTQGIPGLWTGFTGSLALRSNFFWMFLSFEVRGLSPICGAVLEFKFINAGLYEELFKTSGDAVWGGCIILICCADAEPSNYIDQHWFVQFLIRGTGLLCVLGIRNASR